MKLLSSKSLLFAFALAFSLTFTSCEKAESPVAGAPAAEEEMTDKVEGGEKPTKHLQVPDVTTPEDAKRIFLERTAEITGKKTLDNQELHEIHMATYHLEKAVAYYAENSEGPQKEAAEQIAIVVEEVHLSSETFKPEEARKHLDEFAKLAKKFSATL